MSEVDIVTPDKKNMLLLKLISDKAIKKSFGNFCELKKVDLSYVMNGETKQLVISRLNLDTITNIIYYAYPARFPLQLSPDVASEALLRISKERMLAAANEVTFLAMVDNTTLRVYLSPNKTCWQFTQPIPDNDESLTRFGLLTREARISKQWIFMLDLMLNKCDAVVDDKNTLVICVTADVCFVEPRKSDGTINAYYESDQGKMTKFPLNGVFYQTTFSNLTDKYKQKIQKSNEPGDVLDDQIIYVRLLDNPSIGYETIGKKTQLKAELLQSQQQVFVNTTFLQQGGGRKQRRSKK